MEFNYRKNNNNLLFNEKNKSNLELDEIQNYIPLYNRFFNLTEHNSSSFNLNYTLSLYDIISQENYNRFKCILNNSLTNDFEEKPVFFKFAPLLDPVKYISNKYDISKCLLNLPSISNNENIRKVYDPNNSAYIDGFFTFLTSKLFNNFNFLHGLDCYGNFLAIKNNYIYSIAEDIDFLFNCDQFHENNNKLFKLTNNSHIEKMNFDTRNNKKKINILDESINTQILNLSDINDIETINNVFTNSINISNDKNKSLIFECDIDINKNSKKTNHTSSTCSSRSSNTNSNSNSNINSNSNSNENSDTDDSNDESNSTCSTASEDEILISINKFPVNITALEACKDTLDSYITNSEKIKDDEWDSIIIQILMMLITYQKVFKLTHNDLHTNNVMYIETEKKFLIYKFNNKHYKIPTFGKIYKIIDFGRAIYSFKGKTMCSDSYHKDGDAASLYNFDVYQDESKPIIQPNFSFDLSRLGCSIFDFFIEDLDDLNKIKSTIKNIILSWCIDDKDRNILYKNNGQERYPEFKLYKMIARTVHKHIPENVIENNHFVKYIIAKKNINKKSNIMNIDDLPILI